MPVKTSAGSCRAAIVLVALAAACARSAPGPRRPGYITEEDSGKTFTFSETERFGFWVEKHSLRSLDTSGCDFLGLVSNWSLNGPNRWPVGYQVTGAGSCVVRARDFHVRIVGVLQARATPSFTDGGAAGACGRATGPIVLVTFEPDVPNPRCVIVRGSQTLRVVNHFDKRVVARLGSVKLVVPPRGAASTTKPFESYLEPGGHLLTTDLYDGKTYSVEIRYKP